METSVRRDSIESAASVPTTPARPLMSGIPAAINDPKASTSNTKTSGKVNSSTRARSVALALSMSKLASDWPMRRAWRSDERTASRSRGVASSSSVSVPSSVARAYVV